MDPTSLLAMMWTMSEPSEVKLYLREWMAHLGVTQEELAGRSGYTPSFVSEIASNKKRFNRDHLVRFSAALGVTPAQRLLAPPPADVVPIFAASRPLDEDDQQQIRRYIEFIEASATAKDRA